METRTNSNKNKQLTRSNERDDFLTSLRLNDCIEWIWPELNGQTNSALGDGVHARLHPVTERATSDCSTGEFVPEKQ